MPQALKLIGGSFSPPTDSPSACLSIGLIIRIMMMNAAAPSAAQTGTLTLEGRLRRGLDAGFLVTGLLEVLAVL